MQKHPRVTEARIAAALPLLKERIYPVRIPLAIEACAQPGEPVFPAKIPAEGFEPFAVGQAWGAAWSTTWFRFAGTVPGDWSGRNVVALVRLGYRNTEGFTSEGLVWQEGKPVRALNVNRAEIPVANPARGGEEFSCVVEAAANPNVKTWLPSPPPAEAGLLFNLEQAELACFDAGAFELHQDLSVAHGAMMTLPENAPRRAELLRAGNDALNVLDFADASSFPAAREALRGVLACKNGSTAHAVSAIGHAHIDTAWLWPLRETMRKCARTFSTQLTLMARHPEFVFCASQAQQYAWMKEYYPEIFAGIREAVARGQWELVGGMWVEPDGNLPGGESFVRQILHGQNFFLDEFGVAAAGAWMPDTFGLSGALPQILRQAGLDFFLTQKLSWNQFNKFPHHTFWWEGIDGTRLLSHFPPADTYNARFAPAELAEGVANFEDHGRSNRSLYVYGFGDGGGGPTREMLAAAARLEDFEGLPKVRLEKAARFFEQAHAEARDLQVWSGELYFENHRGTYTSQARDKKGNRKSEMLLREAEFFDSIAGRANYTVKPGVVADHRAVYDITARHATTAAGYLERAWKLLLLNQFHDILPGSSIGRVYRDSTSDYAAIFQLADAVRNPARDSLCARIDTADAEQPVLVFNPGPFARSEVVSRMDGSPMHVSVPACGYAVIDAAAKHPVASYAHPVEVIERRRVIAIDNGMLRIIVDRATGNLHSIHDHRHDREVLARGAGNLFQLHRDLPNQYDAWDVEAFYNETVEEIGGIESIEVVERDACRAAVRIARKFGNSAMVQRISITAGSARIDFDTEIEWHEEHKFLRVAFPVNVRAPRATYEIQYGNLERPTHANTSWDLARFEVCAQKWADLSEGDYGVALLNDCKYGCDIHEGTMRLSLLRAPTAPDPEADRGHHQFTYALLPHGGDFRKGGVVEQAYALNLPLHVLEPERHAGNLPASRSFFQVDRPGLVIEAVKHVERGEGIVVRLYEAHGTRGLARMKTALPLKHVFEADLLERAGAPVDCADGEIAFQIEPYEIVTFLLILA